MEDKIKHKKKRNRLFIKKRNIAIKEITKERI